MKEINQRKSGAILSYASIIINTLIQLIYTPLLIRMLGQSEYGLYSLINSVIGYLSVLDLGFGNAIIVYTAKYKAENDIVAEKKLHGMFKIVFLVIGFIAMLLGLVLYFNVNTFFGDTMSIGELNKAKVMMLILTFNLGITFSFSIYSSIISAYEKFTYQKLIAIISAIMKPLIMIPLLFLGFKSVTMAVVITIVNVFGLVSNYYYCRKKLNINIKYSGFDKVLFKTILGYSIWIFLGVIVDKINWSIDQFVLGAVSGTIAVSVYAVASQINNLFVNLSTAITGVLLPKMVKMIAKNTSAKEITNEFIKVGRIQFYIIFLMVSGLVLFGKKFIVLWAGENYIEAYYCLLFLAIPLSFSLIQNLGISIRQALNRHKFATIVNMIVAILNLIISIFLAKKYGPIGSSIGTGIGTLISIIIIDFYYYIEIKIDVIEFWKNIIKLLVIDMSVFLVFYILINKFIIDGILGIVMYGVLYTFVFGFITYFACMSEYEKDLLKKIMIRFGGKNA